jgi:DNA-binding beta-propeller fold protein YncE
MRRAAAGLLLFAGLGLVAAGCGSGSAGSGAGGEVRTGADPSRGPRPGSTVTDLRFLYAWENEPDKVYFPLSGVAGCGFSPEGTLIITDEQRGKVFGLEYDTQRWYEFDASPSRPYRPLDVQVDGFKVLVLDGGGGTVQRFDLNGAWLDQLIDIQRVDPVDRAQMTAFALDRDGRMVVTDVSQQQVLLLDTFMNLVQRVGDPGSLEDQFNEPSGLAFLPDGSFLVADRGNRRLALYGRLGFFEGNVGGDFDPANFMLAPTGLAVDRHGNIFVADAGLGQIHVLDRRARFLFSLGRDLPPGAAPVGPVDVAVGPGELLAVTDRGRSAVLIYQIIYE